MSRPLPELPVDFSHVDMLSEAAFWCVEMAHHHSMVIAGHHGYDLAAKVYLEAAEKLVTPLASGKGKEREESNFFACLARFVLCCIWCADMLGAGRRS